MPIVKKFVTVKQLQKENNELCKCMEKLTTDYNFKISKNAHETGNSLALIVSSLQLLEKQHPHLKSYPHWNEAIYELNFLRALSKELQSSEDPNRLHLISINMETFLYSIFQSFKSFEELSGFICKLEVIAPIPNILIDPIKLKQAILNLSKNAYEAMQTTGTLYFKLYTKNGFLYLSITDNGPGLDIEVSKHLFDAYVTTKESGGGLGLPITKQIIEAHNGSLTFVTKAQTGTTFTIKLPLSRSELK